MSFVLDTMVVSEKAKPARRRHPAASAWLDGAPDGELFLAAVTIGELRRGIELKRRYDEPASVRLEAWLAGVVSAFDGRILAVDVAVAQAWGVLAMRTGMLIVDTYVAATALAHRLTVVTRNVRDFERFGVPVLNPYEDRP